MHSTARRISTLSPGAFSRARIFCADDIERRRVAARAAGAAEKNRMVRRSDCSGQVGSLEEMLKCYHALDNAKDVPALLLDYRDAEEDRDRDSGVRTN